MAAYSMDLRMRVLEDSDAGMRADAVAEKYRVSLWVANSQSCSRHPARIRVPVVRPIFRIRPGSIGQ